MNTASPIKPANRPTRASRPRKRGIVIREPVPQVQQEQQAKPEASDGTEDPEYKRKGKRKMKKAYVEPYRDSTPSPLRRVMRETAENKLKEEAWLQKQRNIAVSVGASQQRSSSTSLEMD